MQRVRHPKNASDDPAAGGAILAFVADERDERGHQLNHASRVVDAIRKQARRNIPLMLAIMHVDVNGAVEDVIMGVYTVIRNDERRIGVEARRDLRHGVAERREPGERGFLDVRLVEDRHRFVPLNRRAMAKGFATKS